VILECSATSSSAFQCYTLLLGRSQIFVSSHAIGVLKKKGTTAPKIKMKLSAIGTVAVLHFITVFVREGHGDEVHSLTISIFKPGLKLLCRLILLGIDQAGCVLSQSMSLDSTVHGKYLYSTRH
jgi:hypothetical protein